MPFSLDYSGSDFLLVIIPRVNSISEKVLRRTESHSSFLFLWLFYNKISTTEVYSVE